MPIAPVCNAAAAVTANGVVVSFAVASDAESKLMLPSEVISMTWMFVISPDELTRFNVTVCDEPRVPPML
jgi:hypothetical protein